MISVKLEPWKQLLENSINLFLTQQGELQICDVVKCHWSNGKRCDKLRGNTSRASVSTLKHRWEQILKGGAANGRSVKENSQRIFFLLSSQQMKRNRSVTADQRKPVRVPILDFTLLCDPITPWTCRKLFSTFLYELSAHLEIKL